MVRLASLLLASLLLAGPAAASDAKGTESMTVAAYGDRALDHLLKAREQLGQREAFAAGQELVHARTLLGLARSATPEGAVQEALDEALRRLDDPKTKAVRTLIAPVFEALEASGLPEKPGYTRRYVERARYELHRGNRAGAVKELAAASARLPGSKLDLPLATCIDQVNRALAALTRRDLASARQLVAGAERSTLGVVRVAGGLDEVFVGDVAAPPPLAGETPTESDIERTPDFSEGF